MGEVLPTTGNTNLKIYYKTLYGTKKKWFNIYFTISVVISRVHFKVELKMFVAWLLQPHAS